MSKAGHSRAAANHSHLTSIALIIAVLVAVPVLSVFSNVLTGGTGETCRTWPTRCCRVPAQHGPALCRRRAGVSSIGVTTAWLTTMHDFPGGASSSGRWSCRWPCPLYVMAYVYTDFLQFVGPVQSGLRETFGWRAGDYWFPDVRSSGGAIAMFMFVLFLMFMFARTAFLERAGGDARSRPLAGSRPWACFVQVSLPLARPAIVAGTALALMETLADYGTVAYFGVQTFTTGIYRAWFSLGDRVAGGAALGGPCCRFVVVV